MKSLDLLHPTLKSQFEALRDLASQRLGLRIIVTQTLRSNAEQYALWCQGRMSLAEVNSARSKASMSPITEAENKGTITNAKTAADSFHGYGLAFDIAITDPNGKRIKWNKSDWNSNNIDDWSEVGALAEEVGLEWGGNFTSIIDPPHYQNRLGYTISALKKAGIQSGKTLSV